MSAPGGAAAIASLPLALLADGETGEIVEVAPGAAGGGAARAEDLGLRVGKRVRVLANCAGPILVKVDESRIAVARGVAMKITVRSA